METRPENAFLNSLDDHAQERLSESLTLVDLRSGAYVQWNEQPTEWVYFPETSTLSMIATDLSARTVETSMVGCEGAAGFIEACNESVSTWIARFR